MADPARAGGDVDGAIWCHLPAVKFHVSPSVTTVALKPPKRTT
jgi:hypothetical protein